jgi:uncharacterized protein
MNKNYTYLATDGEKLKISTYIDENIFCGRTLIFVHGFKGFKDWGFVPYIGEQLAKQGFFVITFNFSHNGIGENLTEFTELEKFAKNTYSREIRELDEIISAIRNGYFNFANDSKIGLIGHSRGGAIALLTVPMRNDISAVATWASIAHLDRYSERQKVEWRNVGYLESLNTRTNQLMRMNISLLEDIEKNAEGLLNIEKAVKNLNCLLLIAHGDQDLAVPIAEGEQLYEWADKSKTEFVEFCSTGHTFDIVHPFKGTTKKFENLMAKTIKFFEENMS